MKIVQPSFEVLDVLDGTRILRNLELIGRVCYKSEENITPNSSKEFVGMLIRKGHESVIEHEKMTVRFICDRGISHEIVRHRLASFSQESTRYCDYSKDKFGGDISFIDPKPFMNNLQYVEWVDSVELAEKGYKHQIESGSSAQIARSVLPNSLKTEIVVTANMREWRTIFKQRTAPAAHPQMRQIMVPLLAYVKECIPVLFDDL